MSEIMDLVVIEKKNAMAVFTNNDQLRPAYRSDRKRGSQPGAGRDHQKRPRRHRIHGSQGRAL